MILMEIMQL